MLTEDIGHRIVPFGNHSRNWPDYKVTVEPHSDATSELLLDALALEDREFDLASAFGAFVRRTASLILHQSDAYFEIVFDQDVEPKRFKIVPFPAGEVKIFEGTVTQMIPREIQDARNLGQPFVDISESSVLHISFPDSLGGKVAARELATAFDTLGNSMMPRFAEGGLRGPDAAFNFAVSAEYRKLRDVALGQATSKLGWDARSLLDNRSTEIYKYYRMIKFCRSLSLLREHILHRLNVAIAASMTRIGQRGVLVVAGLPSSQMFEVKLAELLDGELTFHDATTISGML